MSNAGDKLKERLKEKGKEVKEKKPVSGKKLTQKETLELCTQMLKDFGYIE